MVSTAPKQAEKTPDAEPTVRLTVAQATIRFLANQYVERDGERSKFFAGCFGIFGHGNVAGLGQALLAGRGRRRTEPVPNPRCDMCWAATSKPWSTAPSAYARQKDRLQTWAVTASVGPGVDQHADRRRAGDHQPAAGAAAARRHLRHPGQLARAAGTRAADAGDVTVNDAFKPLSRYFDRVWRPEQLPSALLGAMRVLTDPVETGAATVAIPQDVQAEAHDWPESLFAERTWHIARPVPERSVIARAAEVIRSAQRPLIVAGGGVHLLRRRPTLWRRSPRRRASRSAESQAGKGSLRYDHPQAVGAIGSTGTTAANALAAEADVVIGIGTRYSDFTSASRTAFNNPDVRFVNINVASFDAVKQGGVSRRRRRPRGDRGAVEPRWPTTP